MLLMQSIALSNARIGFFKSRNININNSNVILTNGKLKYYLYVDLISYYNKVNNNYNESANPYYSKNINYNNGFVSRD